MNSSTRISPVGTASILLAASAAFFVSVSFASAVSIFSTNQTTANLPAVNDQSATTATTIPNASAGADTQTLTPATPVPNAAGVVEVKASRTLTVTSIPHNNDTITIGTCVVTFSNNSGDSLNCSGNAATIERNTGGETTGTIATSLQGLTNVSGGVHGALTVGAPSGTTVKFTTAGAETSATSISFVDGSSGRIASTTDIRGVVAAPAVAQVSTAAPANVEVGDTFTVTINSTPINYVALNATVADVTAGLTSAINGSSQAANVTAVDEGTDVKITANVAGTAFTFATSATNHAAIAQVNTVTITGTVETGDQYSVTIPSGTVNYTVTGGDTTTSDIASHLNTAIQASGGYAGEAFTTGVAGNVITFTAKVAGTGFTQTSNATNRTPIAQIVDFTPNIAIPGLTYRAIINGNNYDYVAGGGDTVATIVTGLQPLMDADPAVHCSQDATKVTCTADTAGTAFTYSANAQDRTPPVVTPNVTGPLTIHYGDIYTEAGATAIDSYEGDLSPTSVSGSVNTSVLGDYTVTYSRTDSAGNTGTASLLVHVVQRPLTLGVSADNKVYDGNTSATANVSVTPLPADTGNLGVTWGSATFSDKNVGTGKTVTIPSISLTGSAAGNYTVDTSTTTTADITARSITVTAQPDAKVYDGSASSGVSPVITLGILQGTDTSGFTQAFDTKNVGTGKTLSVAGAVNDGNGGANYNVTTVNDTTGVITVAPLTITAQTNTKTYDGIVSAAATLLVAGTQAGDTVTGLAETYDNKNVGTGKTLSVSAYTVNDGNGGNNYSVATVPNTTGVINQSILTLTPNDQTKIYGDTFTFTGTEFFSGGPFAGDSIDSVELTSTGAAASADVGSYNIVITPGSATGVGLSNYDLHYNVGTLTVNKAPSVTTVTCSGVPVTYNGAAQTPCSADVTGAGGLSQSLTVNYSNNTSAGTATADASYAGDANHNASSDSKTFTISPASLAVTAQDKSKTAGTGDPALTYTHGALQGTDADAVFSGALARVAGENVGNYAINQGTLSAGGNYAISFTAGTFSVNPDTTQSNFTMATSTSGSNVTGTIPGSTSKTTSAFANNVIINIPAGTGVTGPSSWDGTVSWPTETSTPPTEAPVAPPGSSVGSVAGSIEIGFPQTILTFDRAVQIIFVGQAGKTVGYSYGFGTFHAITTVCGDNTQVTNDLLPAGKECFISDDGSGNLVVWTKHFTLYTLYTLHTPSTGGGTPTNGNGGANGPVVAQAPAAAAPSGGTGGTVLGAAAFNFQNDMGLGSTLSPDVTELQKVLIAEGFLKIDAPTGSFGPKTLAAVKAYQAAHGISPQSGYVGPKTRAVLNGGTTPTMSDEQRALLIQNLQAQLQTLMQKIQQMMSGQH